MREFKVKISNELHSALQHIAQARGQTVTALVKRAIRQELGHEKIEESENAPVKRDGSGQQRPRMDGEPAGGQSGG